MRQLLIMLLLTILTGCAVNPKTHQSSITVPDTLPQKWTVEGRIALKTPQDKFSASMQWQQDKQDYQLRLSKLIGGTLLYMENHNSMVELQFDDQTYRDTNAERLLWQVTGWTLPVTDFKYWISGLPDPNGLPPLDLTRDDNARIKSFTSADNWQVQYQNYKVFADKMMPHNLTIKKDNIQLRLRVSDWEFEK